MTQYEEDIIGDFTFLSFKTEHDLKHEYFKRCLPKQTLDNLQRNSSPKRKLENGNQSLLNSKRVQKMDERPPYTYNELVKQAISSSHEKRLTLHQIIAYITSTYPYYSNYAHSKIKNGVSTILYKKSNLFHGIKDEFSRSIYWSYDEQTNNAHLMVNEMAQASTETSLLQPIAVADNVQREDSQLIPYSLYAQEIEKYRAEKENLVQVILKINQILSLSVETLADKEADFEYRKLCYEEIISQLRTILNLALVIPM